jgi:hypothetical protein
VERRFAIYRSEHDYRLAETWNWVLAIAIGCVSGRGRGPCSTASMDRGELQLPSAGPSTGPPMVPSISAFENANKCPAHS